MLKSTMLVGTISQTKQHRIKQIKIWVTWVYLISKYQSSITLHIAVTYQKQRDRAATSAKQTYFTTQVRVSLFSIQQCLYLFNFSSNKESLEIYILRHQLQYFKTFMNFNYILHVTSPDKQHFEKVNRKFKVLRGMLRKPEILVSERFIFRDPSIEEVYIQEVQTLGHGPTVGSLQNSSTPPFLGRCWVAPLPSSC